ARIGEPPPDTRIRDRGWSPVPRGAALHHDIRRPRHALDTARDETFAFARVDRVGRAHHRLEAGAAETVNRLPGHVDREAGQKKRHARDIPVILAGLVYAAEDDVIDPRRIETRPAGGLTDRDRGE